MIPDTVSINSILNRKYWIFDLDGTLTVPVHDFPAIRRQLGIPQGHDIIKHITSQEKSQAQVLLEKLNSIEIDLAEETKPAAGVKELVLTLIRHSVRMGIITRNTKETARRSLDKMGILPFFQDDCILGRWQAPPKPDPYGILHLLACWNATPQQAVMVGDYLFDLQAGKSAGTATIHVNQNQDVNWDDLTDLRVKSLAEVVTMFETHELSRQEN